MGDTLLPGGRWYAVRDGDPRGLSLYRRHYSAKLYRDGRERRRRLYAGPGEKLVLLTPRADALFIWRVERFRRDRQQGVNCAVFRNESPWRASDLVREACVLAWTRWPGARLFTLVNPRLIASAVPGYCFRRAGWKRCGMSRRGLLIFERVA